MTQFEEYYRIWLKDEVEPEGGFWWYCGLDKLGFVRQLNFDYNGKENMLISFEYYQKNGFKIECIKSKHKKFTDRLIEEQRKQNKQILDSIYSSKNFGLDLEKWHSSKPKGWITQVAFADSEKDAEKVIFYMKKYIELKEVIENMITRLDEGAELKLTKDNFIVHCLRQAIK